jgi:hypothetical protein
MDESLRLISALGAVELSRSMPKRAAIPAGVRATKPP